MDADRYNMNHKNRGKCIIFNHVTFEERNVANRNSSIVDANRLDKSFRKLGFEVEIIVDLRHRQILDKIEELRRYDHTDNDCLCVVVLTHGETKEILWAKDLPYNSQDIWKPFTANNCTTLAGKPKLFFFQACRGNEIERSVKLYFTRCIENRRLDTSIATCDEISGCSSKKDIPLPKLYKDSYSRFCDLDILRVYSTVEKFYSWRNTVSGSWYIQCLCDLLDEHGTKMDLLKLLTLTAQKVATDFSTKKEQKQMSLYKSMLIRSVYFPPKSNEQMTTV